MSGEERSASPKPQRLVPRDAATLVVVDLSRGAPRILMGRRHPEQIFLPNRYVFPGGRVEGADRTVARAHLAPGLGLPEPHARLLEIAMKGRPSPLRATALALAAVRETFEETGFIVGTRAEPAGMHGSGGWQAFHAEGFRPDLRRLSYFARAITPPGRPRRYDTRFFAVDASAVAHRIERADGELLDVGWYTLAETRDLKLASITRVVIEDLAAWLAAPPAADAPQAIPFYFHRRGRFERASLGIAYSPA